MKISPDSSSVEVTLQTVPPVHATLRISHQACSRGQHQDATTAQQPSDDLLHLATGQLVDALRKLLEHEETRKKAVALYRTSQDLMMLHDTLPNAVAQNVTLALITMSTSVHCLERKNLVTYTIPLSIGLGR